ncbi:sugar phosphate isomerase/epimerase [uncultured Alistipes sp.]|uniref:sugar phosphate isomerase/epimerase family protein n=1 Tax=uncultured Alistipes sp. TaxID=538949 RepID=UPI002636090F|nr:sugar phosphate isomerase/epimerase [uncultured Alistipes sp.]
MDRREFLKKSMLLSAAALVGGKLFSHTAEVAEDKAKRAPRKKKEIGIQLYSVRGDMGENAAATLKKLSEMGYTTVETAAYGDGKFYGLAPAEFRKMAEDVGIRVTGAHLGIGLDRNNLQGCLDWWKQACDAQVAVGGKYIVLPGFSVGPTLAELQEYCDYFNRIGEIANAAGLRYGYHNHSHEFAKLEGHVIEDYLIENTDPDKVMFELDVFWATKGGVNPSAYIAKYAGRFPLLHIKDEDIIGASETIDFESIFDAAYKQGLEAYYVEIEANSLPPMVCAQKSADYLDVSKFVK